MIRTLRHDEGHFHCIHNDLPPKTHNFTMKGMFAAVVWIAFWSLIIMGFVGNDVQRARRVAAYWEGRHMWTTTFVRGEQLTLCGKCQHAPGSGSVCAGRPTG